MKKNYWISVRDREKNDCMFIACKQTWRLYDTKYTRKKELVTCEKCKEAIRKKKFD